MAWLGRCFTTNTMMMSSASEARVEDLLDFGQLFKAFGNNYFAQISHILRQFLKRCQNLPFFSWNHFWATLIDICRFFSGHTDGKCKWGRVSISAEIYEAGRIHYGVTNVWMDSCWESSVTRLADFWKFLATNLLSKVAQNDCSLLGYFENDQLR